MMKAFQILKTEIYSRPITLNNKWGLLSHQDSTQMLPLMINNKNQSATWKPSDTDKNNFKFWNLRISINITKLKIKITKTL